MNRIILFSLLTLSILASCSKEKRIENHLSRKDGIWYINKATELDYKDGNQTDMYVGMNLGFFQFQESQNVENNNALHDIPHLTKWLDPQRLSINLQAAHYFLEYYNYLLIQIYLYFQSNSNY